MRFSAGATQPDHLQLHRAWEKTAVPAHGELTTGRNGGPIRRSASDLGLDYVPDLKATAPNVEAGRRIPYRPGAR